MEDGGSRRVRAGVNRPSATRPGEVSVAARLGNWQFSDHGVLVKDSAW